MGHDIEVSVVTVRGEPLILPTQIVEQADPGSLRIGFVRDLPNGSYQTDPEVSAALDATIELLQAIYAATPGPIQLVPPPPKPGECA